MRFPGPKLGVRSRLLLAVLAGVAVGLVAMIVAFNIVLEQRLSANATELARARATAQLSTLRVANGQIRRAEAPDEAAVDSPVWIFDGRTALEEPAAVRRDVAAAAASLATSQERTADVAAADVRLVAEPVASGGSRLGTVVAGVSLGPYEETRSLALIGSVALGAVLLVVVALATRWMLAAALRPVARMTADAAAWSERDLERRFAVGEPHDEITRLAATLDTLLARLAASLRREQRFTAELSHELRTPLAGILAEAELALSRPRRDDEYRQALVAVERGAAQMRRTVETLLAAARQEASPARTTADARAAAAGTIQTCAELARERGVSLSLASSAAVLRVGVEAAVVERALQPLVENACRYGRGEARVTVERNGTGILFTVEDDGPGVLADERERIFEPGSRGSAATNGDGLDGVGLGLALARRLARAAGGDVTVGGQSPGARFVLVLPAA